MQRQVEIAVALSAGWPLTRTAGQPRGERRKRLFRETPKQRLRRIALGTVWALRPKRAANLLPLGALCLDQWLRGNRAALPDPAKPKWDSEFAGFVSDMSVPVLLEAHASGLFPYGHYGPLKWMTPKERCVLSFESYHISRRVRAMLRQNRWRVTFDSDFDGVMAACAAPRKNRPPLTWITPRIMHAYAALHDAGHAHSYEVWDETGALIAGGYGVAVGGMFVIESQFTRVSNASKYGFSVLAWHLAKWGFKLCDNKWATPTTLEQGFHEVPRSEFLGLVAQYAGTDSKPGHWKLEDGPQEIGHADFG
ncbi:leucyl/phenylalanyl-tRNA--protein transferase [Methyloligella sp. 2.7D]|uniref:leucyl/phenylalanyl-tRNA--protein transferase n=1 Tax=unclassified Methyloligella TaxID=2625955 RepID=UPI00157E088D|nr:leucyl/phenylalanyl-tRNA--protein transferase [Methyloligella sp. GL2]QKP77339.1 leucyl/phenylalanyl-tRNA--protein transferase [Methyloligella sp. GL2]